MIRQDELAAIKAGTIDLAFRRWDRARVKVGTRLRTSVGVVEVTSVETIPESRLRADDARRAGVASVGDLRKRLSGQDGAIHRVGLRFAGPDPRDALREQVPEADEIVEILTWLDRLDAASKDGPWTRATLDVIDASPGVRAPELAAGLGRETPSFKTDVRKLKEKGLTESLAIGYRLSPRGEAVVDHGRVPRVRTPRPDGTSLPRNIGAPATAALRVEGVETLEQVATWSVARLAALHGVGPVAIERLGHALAERGLGFASD